jgi:hypothetical protein
MWSMWAGECMEDRCRHTAVVWITTQLRWNSAVAVWTFCAGHASEWIGLFVAAHMYYLQIEVAGTIQQELPLG